MPTSQMFKPGADEVCLGLHGHLAGSLGMLFLVFTIRTPCCPSQEPSQSWTLKQECPMPVAYST